MIQLHSRIEEATAENKPESLRKALCALDCGQRDIPTRVWLRQRRKPSQEQCGAKPSPLPRGMYETEGQANTSRALSSVPHKAADAHEFAVHPSYQKSCSLSGERPLIFFHQIGRKPARLIQLVQFDALLHSPYKPARPCKHRL